MRYTLLILGLFLSFNIFAYHIVGGEIYYDYLGNNQYRITLKIYKDCDPSVTTPFDGSGTTPALISVYSQNNTVVNVHDIGDPIITSVPSAFNNQCVYAPNNICVEEGVYTYTLDLPPIAGGYTIVYQRCCRNSSVENLLLPDTQGSTYYTVIPGPETASNNSSPRFNKFPPLYICNNVPFTFDHSATDPDGDQLVYSLCAAYKGLDGCCPSLNTSPPQTGSTCISPPITCPGVASLPPYDPVNYVAPYSGSYPIASSPSFVINPSTGKFSGTPNLSSLYAVGVCIQEYRNNVLINTHFRDFQFSVINCTVSVLSVIAEPTLQCQGLTIGFTNKSLNNSATPKYFWDFGVANLTNDTSNLFQPTYTFPDTGIYKVKLIANPGKPCTDTLEKEIYAYPPFDVKFARPQKQCFKNNSFTFLPQGSMVPQATFLWDFGTKATPLSSTVKNPTGIHFSEDGLHKIILYSKQFACRDTFIDTIEIVPRPKAKINNLPNTLCDPATVGFSNGTISKLPVNYYWTFSNGFTSHQFEPSVVFSPAGVYGAVLVVETDSLCKDTSIASVMNITVTAKPKASFTLSTHEVSIFEPWINYGSYNNETGLNTTFYFGDGEFSKSIAGEHTYKNYGTYRITQVVTNYAGCIDSTSDMVRVLPEFRLWIPNTFTPDEDDRNEVFRPSTIGASNYQLEIYDRWGKQIFKTIDPSQGWNGAYRGEKCQQGVYTWRLTFKNAVTEKSELHLGHVTLLRNP
jgi:gliding motility-associated-like protein